MRKCTICKKDKELTDFNKNYKGKEGLQAHCKECHKGMTYRWKERNIIRYRENAKIFAREYRKQHREDYLAKAKVWRDKNKEKIKQLRIKRIKEIKRVVFNHYGTVCKCCGEKNNMFLTMDHINNDGYLWRKRKQGWLARWIVKNNFPTDIQILCFNCNMGRAFNKSVCPHKLQKVID